MAEQSGIVSGNRTASTLEEFRSLIDARQITGSSYSSLIGLTFYLLVLVDSLLNARGVGGPSVAIIIAAQSIGIIGHSGSGIAWLVAITQISLLIIAGRLLWNSPWRRWLKTSLSSAEPGRWLLHGFQANRKSGGHEAEAWKEVTRDIVLFGFILALFAPSFTQLPFYVGFILLLASSYAALGLCVAVGRHIFHDWPTFVGVVLGLVLIPAFFAFALPDLAISETGPSKIYWRQTSNIEAFIILIAVLLAWSPTLGSVAQSDRLTLTWNLPPAAVLTNLPDTSGAIFTTTVFNVESNRKIIVLSSPVQGGTEFIIHPKRELFLLDNRRWAIFDLQELERRLSGMGSGTGRMEFIRDGFSQYLSCTIVVRLHTLSPEAVFAGRLDTHLRSGKVRIEIGDFHLFSDTMITSEGDGQSAFRDETSRAIAKLIDSELDIVWNPNGEGANPNAMLSSKFAQLNFVTQMIDAQCAAEVNRFSVMRQNIANTGTSAQIESTAQVIRRNILSALEGLPQAQLMVAEIKSLSATQKASLEQQLSGLGERLRSRFEAKATQIKGDYATVSLFDFVTVEVIDVRLALSRAADDTIKKIEEVHAKYNTTQFFREMDAIVSAGAANELEFTRIVASGTPYGNKAIGQLFAREASKADAKLPPASTERPKLSLARQIRNERESGKDLPQDNKIKSTDAGFND